MASAKVKLVTRNNSTFEGILHHRDEFTGKIVLKDVITEGVKLLGPHYFYKEELIDLQYLNSMPSDEKQLKNVKNVKKDEKQSPNSDEKPCLTSFGEKINSIKKSTQPHLSNGQAEEDELTISSMFKDLNGNSNEDNSKDEFEDFYETEDYIIINRLGDQFYEAIVQISGESFVGLQLDGVNIGRNGTLSVVEVATKSKIYIFDIIRIGSKAFSEGLQLIFENHKIMKIIHDCRFISDMIYHKYKTSLNNIFDTQVASAFVHRINNDGEWPESVENLPTCIMNHLNVSSDQPTVSHESFQQNEEEALWLQRPLPKELLTAVSVNASYLIELHNVLLDKMLIEFQTGVQIYLNHVDNLGGEVEISHKSKYRLPTEFNNLQHYMKLYNGQKRRYNSKVDFDRRNKPNIQERKVIKRDDSPNCISNIALSKHRVGPSIHQNLRLLTHSKTSQTNLGIENSDEIDDDSGCNKGTLKTCMQEVKRSNSLLSCPDADSVGDPLNSSLPANETDNKSLDSSPPGRMVQFCEYLQNLSLESDKVDTELQSDRVFNDSTPSANKTGSSVTETDCTKSDGFSTVVEQCARSANEDECCPSPIESHKNTVDVFKTIPAGLRDLNRRKKKNSYDMEKSIRNVTFKEENELDTSNATTDAIEEDYGCIPMQHSLQRSELVVLGSRAIDLRNADVEVDQEADDVEGARQNCSQDAEEKIDKIIKLISSRNIQSKILPCKLKL